MANAIVTLKLMPESPDVDRAAVATEARNIISAFSGEDAESIRVEEEPVAFGLVAVKLTFVADESKGVPDSLEADLSAIDGVQSCQVEDFRRALG